MARTIGHYPELSALSRSIDVSWIAQVLASTGRASVRKRKLPAEQVIWLVIALALYRHQSIPEVVAHLDLTLPDEVNPDIAKSALTQARQRLGRAPLAQLFALSASCWDERHQSGKAWRGLARYAVDGSTLRTSDSVGNRTHFGGQAHSKGLVSSYPQVRLLILTALA
ncbi:transposase domain-containing protein, partial [Labrys miyagiensis]|uniref:transposase domain-containing protein n=1 Tax=Labrys miyagiensis TaxID=346912 RepID=UPI0024E0B7A4